MDELPILRYWKIIKNQNIYLLDKDYFEGKVYDNKKQKEINEIWERLYDEYFSLTDDTSSKAKLKKVFEDFKLKNKIKQVKDNIDFLEILKQYQGVDTIEFEQHTYKRIELIDSRIKCKPFEDNIPYLKKVINSLINTYNLTVKDNSEEVLKQIGNVYEVVANAESWLDRNLDVNNMVTSHWIAIEKQVKQKQKAQQNNGK